MTTSVSSFFSRPLLAKSQFSKSLVLVSALLSVCLLLAPAHAQEKAPFEQWLAELKAETVELGISEESIELAFSEVTAPVQRIIDSDRSQPEVVQTYASYLSARVSDWKEENGQERMLEHEAALANIAAEYGVQARFLVAIWGMETNFGTYPITESVFKALATLAYDNRRAAFFRAQFLAAITMLDSGFPAYENMKSSWAGAMGQSQFIPESYLAYAVDYDGDGHKDIWDTEVDVLASIANYFKVRGWRDDLTWGRPVRLPANGENTLPASRDEGAGPTSQCRRYGSLGVWRDLQEWQALGVRKADGSDLPTRSVPAALVLADKGDNEGYLVYQNFCTIMSYNPSFKYALSIGLLADLLEVDNN